MSAFLMRENKAFAEITGAKDNRGTGYGLVVLLTKLRSCLSLYLLMDIIICVIVTLLNDNWHF